MFTAVFSEKVKTAIGKRHINTTVYYPIIKKYKVDLQVPTWKTMKV